MPLYDLRHPLWQASHRPLFLLAGLWACLGPLVWLLPTGTEPEPLAWHRHELLFGMGGAALGGYLLTALPAWTGQGPIHPRLTFWASLFWCGARLAFSLGGQDPPLALILFPSAYFGLVAAILVHGLWRAGAWQRLGLALSPLAIGAGDIAMQRDIAPLDAEATRLILPLVFGLLISQVGGRLVGAFNRHWRAGMIPAVTTEDPVILARGGAIAIVAAIAAILLDAEETAGLLLLAAGLLHLARLALWQGWRSWRYPALLMLHLAWLWLPAGLVLIGLSLVIPDTVPPSTALHAMTMGAMGTMMLAIMSRAAMIRKPGRLTVQPVLGLAFATVFLAAPVRLLAPWVDMLAGLDPNRLSAGLWSCGWGLFLFGFRRALTDAVPRPVLSASAAK